MAAVLSCVAVVFTLLPVAFGPVSAQWSEVPVTPTTPTTVVPGTSPTPTLPGTAPTSPVDVAPNESSSEVVESDAGDLTATGANSMRLALWAILLVALGAAVVSPGRRRRSTSF